MQTIHTRLGVLFCALGLLLALVAGKAQAQLTGTVSAERSNFDEVFAATNRFYPGQRLLISVSGQIDANHRYWQDRECSWFGLDCDYVNREASNVMDVSRLPLLLALDPDAVLIQPKHTQQTGMIGIAGASYLPVVPDGQYRVLLEVADADTHMNAFTTGTMLRGVVADRYDGAVDINRNACHQRPPMCSSGVYKVTVAVDNTERLVLFKNLLKTVRTPAELLSLRGQDPLFVQDDRVKKAIAATLYQHALQFYKGKQNLERDHLAILSFANELDPTRADILSDITATYIALGEFTSANASVKGAIDAANTAYANEPLPHSAAVVTELSKASGLRASIWVNERGAVVGTDLMVAVGLYREAAGYCNDEAPNGRTSADKRLMYACAKDRLVDAGRTVAMLRSRENLELAEQLMSQAQLAARQAVDAN